MAAIKSIIIVLFIILGATVNKAKAEKLSLTDINHYLNSLESVMGKFVQINSDNTRSNGILYLRRPGRMRFEYEKPNSALVVISGNTIAIFDAKFNTRPQQYPLSKTPFVLLLQKNIDLNANNIVFRQQSDINNTYIFIHNPKQPKNDYIKMVFSNRPIALRQWIISSPNQQIITIN